jgi:hypothetical protein
LSERRVWDRFSRHALQDRRLNLPPSASAALDRASYLPHVFKCLTVQVRESSATKATANRCGLVAFQRFRSPSSSRRQVRAANEGKIKARWKLGRLPTKIEKKAGPGSAAIAT